MRTTLALDDDLLAEAQRLTGLAEKTALVREALTALIERESARRLARRPRLSTPRPGLTPSDAHHSGGAHRRLTSQLSSTFEPCLKSDLPLKSVGCP